MDFKQIQELIKMINKSDISELKIEQGDFKLTIRNQSYQMGGFQQPQIMMAQMPSMQQSAPPLMVPTSSLESPKSMDSDSNNNQEEKSAPTGKNLIEFKSPMIGTFYRTPSPDKDAFVKVGDEVKTGDIVCIIEAMKLFNEIEFEGQGKIVKVLVENATPVEYEQPLFLIEPF